MDSWQLYAFLAALASVLAWFYCHERKLPKGWAKAALLLSAALYLLLFLLGAGGIGPLVRDLAIFALAAFLGFYFAESARLLALAVVALALLVQLVYFGFPWGGARPSPAAVDAAGPPPPSQVAVDAAGELLVDLAQDASASGISAALEAWGVEIRRAFPDLGHPGYSDLDEYYVVDVADERAGDLEAVIDALYATGDVDWVERNEVVRLTPVETTAAADAAARPRAADAGPNDPLAGRQWALEPLGMSRFYRQLSAAGLEPKKRATVAILDTGIDAGHEDLSGNYVSTDPAFDVDVLGHGTHCAGVAGAVTNNGIGIASIAPAERFLAITSIRVLGPQGVGTQHTILQGILRAADEGVDVISLSFGGPSDDGRQRAYDEAVKYADRAGAILVAAAGNDGADARRHLPAGCDGVIAVAAVDRDLSPASFSNDVGDLAMGVAAPGVDVFSTRPGDGYAYASGTSVAAPLVAGLLGVLRALDPDLTTREAFELLQASGIETNDTRATGRLIQPAAVLRAMNITPSAAG